MQDDAAQSLNKFSAVSGLLTRSDRERGEKIDLSGLMSLSDAAAEGLWPAPLKLIQLE